MHVTVRLFARLREIAGASELTREVAPGATIGTLWRLLAGGSLDSPTTKARSRRP